MAEVPAVKQFITEDEIGAALSGGGGFAGGKGRIYAFFQQPHTDKEKTAFLRQEYGTGGCPTHCPVQRTVAKITMERACATRKTAVTMYA